MLNEGTLLKIGIANAHALFITMRIRTMASAAVAATVPLNVCDAIVRRTIKRMWRNGDGADEHKLTKAPLSTTNGVYCSFHRHDSESVALSKNEQWHVTVTRPIESSERPISIRSSYGSVWEPIFRRTIKRTCRNGDGADGYELTKAQLFATNRVDCSLGINWSTSPFDIRL